MVLKKKMYENHEQQKGERQVLVKKSPLEIWRKSTQPYLICASYSNEETGKSLYTSTFSAWVKIEIRFTMFASLKSINLSSFRVRANSLSY